MKKRRLFLVLTTFCLLASCGTSPLPDTTDPDVPGPVDPEKPTPDPTPDPEPDPKPDPEPDPPPVEDKVDQAILKKFTGRYFYYEDVLEVSKEGTVTLSSKALVPTGTSTEHFDTEEGGFNTPVVVFGKHKNDKDLRIRFSNNRDYTLLLEEKTNTGYKLIGDFQPDCPGVAGVYTFYGDGSTYNVNFQLTNIFNTVTNEFVLTQAICSANAFSTVDASYDTSIYNVKGQLLYGIDVYLGGDPVGKYYHKFAEDGSGILFDVENGIDYSMFSDPGLFNFQYFVSETEKIDFLPTHEESSVVMNGVRYAYSEAFDAQGQYFTLTSDTKTATVRPEKFGVVVTEGEKVTHGVFDTMFELEGKEYKNDEIAFEYSKNETGDAYVLKVNEKETTYSFVVENGTKSIKFTENGKEYIVSPYHNGISARVKVGDKVGYLVNEKDYLMLYTNKTLINVTNGVTTKYAIDNAGVVTVGKESVNGHLTYDPRVSAEPLYEFTLKGDKHVMSLEECETLLVVLTNSKGTSYLFAEETLQGLYDSYTTHHEVEFKFDANGATLRGKSLKYSLVPLDIRLGCKMGIILHDTEDVVFEAYSYGTLVERVADGTKKSYIKQESFLKLCGTYILNGAMGPERFILTADGHFKADTPNSDKTALVLVEYPYQLSEFSNPIDGTVKTCLLYYVPQLNVSIFLYKEPHGLLCFGELYVTEDLFSIQGVYTDEAVTSVVELNKDTLKIDGQGVVIDTVTKNSNVILVKGKQGEELSFTLSESSISLQVKDKEVSYSKVEFNPEVYLGTYKTKEADGKDVKFIKEVDEITGIVLGYKLSVDGSLFEGTLIARGGKITYEFNVFGEKYYIFRDGETNKLEIVGTLPPPPPPPPPGPPIPPPPPPPPAPPPPPPPLP